jgi:hypothetical protein
MATMAIAANSPIVHVNSVGQPRKGDSVPYTGRPDLNLGKLSSGTGTVRYQKERSLRRVELSL